jgi:hypothetical protein
MLNTGHQIVTLFILAIPVACIAWTITHEEIFREPREYCVRCSQQRKSLVARKFFYVFTCEYCFSHYVVLLLLLITKFQLLYEGWKGYVLAGFSLVWIANIYMGLYSKIRLEIKKEKIEIKEKKPDDPAH